MKVYHFESLLGTVYRKGNVLFLKGGDVLLSPVGNRITQYDLKKHETKTLNVEGSHNYVAIDVSKNGLVLAAGNEVGEVHIISLVSKTMVHCLRMDRAPSLIRFSPDGSHFAVAKGDTVFIYESPTATKCFNPFVMKRVFHDATDDVTSLDWSCDSKLVLVGSKDMMIHVYTMQKFSNFRNVAFTSHSEAIVSCFFSKNSYDLYSISSGGKLCVWGCTISPEEFVELNDERNTKAKDSDESEDEFGTPEELLTKKKADKKKKSSEPDENAPRMARFTREAMHFFNDLFATKEKRPFLECADFDKSNNLLVTGFGNGSFFIHELPDFTLLQSLSISEHKITTVSINETGDWIAFGCPTLGQLLVWEWQSETYVMKQQGHFDTMNTCDYSYDGRYIVTGGEDGKVKLWETQNSFCFVTFTEHTASVSGVVFTQNGNAIVSSSLDGTVRAFDLARYRNFRTFTTPKPAQFSCVSVDASGELIAAGAFDVFEVFVWSMKVGRLLNVCSGHEGPVSAVVFSPSAATSQLASVSWDRTLIVWDAIELSGNRQIVDLNSEGTCLAFRPDGLELAVGTLNGEIQFLDPKDTKSLGVIEGRNHLGAGRSETDLVTSKKNLAAKAFTTIAYSPDGLYLLAGGQSKNVCFYDADKYVLLLKYEITQNKSLDGMNDFVHHRKMTEFGNMSLVEDRSDESMDAIRLPGVKKGDMASRSFNPEVRVSSVQFSPTGSQWIATTTEGLLLYHYDSWRVFMPIGAHEDVTPNSIRKALAAKEYDRALMHSLHLNLDEYSREVLEAVPVSSIHAVCDGVNPLYRGIFLKFLAEELGRSKHFQFCLIWIETFLKIHLNSFKHSPAPPELAPALNDLKKNVSKKSDDVMAIANNNRFAIEYLLKAGETRRLEPKPVSSPGSESDHADLIDVEFDPDDEFTSDDLYFPSGQYDPVIMYEPDADAIQTELVLFRGDKNI